MSELHAKLYTIGIPLDPSNLHHLSSRYSRPWLVATMAWTLGDLPRWKGEVLGVKWVKLNHLPSLKLAVSALVRAVSLGEYISRSWFFFLMGRSLHKSPISFFMVLSKIVGIFILNIWVQWTQRLWRLCMSNDALKNGEKTITNYNR